MGLLDADSWGLVYNAYCYLLSVGSALSAAWKYLVWYIRLRLQEIVPDMARLHRRLVVIPDRIFCFAILFGTYGQESEYFEN